MEPRYLQNVLERAAEIAPSSTVKIYPAGETTTPVELTYAGLLEKARRSAQFLKSIPDFKIGTPIIVYLDDHVETIVWMWAVLLADGVPSVISPFSPIADQRHIQIQSLVDTLETKFCITRKSLRDLFANEPRLTLHFVESLNQRAQEYISISESDSLNININYDLVSSDKTQQAQKYFSNPVRDDDLAMLMMTSGSTGNAKAVRLNHKQLIASIKGRVNLAKLSPEDSYFNWVGFDHVASLSETMFQAFWLGVDQVHTSPMNMIPNPMLYLDYMSQYKVARSFAPNFLLAKLAAAIKTAEEKQPDIGQIKKWDFSHLKFLSSGGEANQLQLVASLEKFFSKYGAPPATIKSGWGMTETSAFMTYQIRQTAFDDSACEPNSEALADQLLPVGPWIAGSEVRIKGENGIAVYDGSDPNFVGALEVRGDVILNGYYNNDAANKKSFDEEGWFDTGDQASIDADGNLVMIGRAKDILVVNGVNHLPQDIEHAIISISPVFASLKRNICFPFRARNAASEGICIIYLAPMGLSEKPALLYEIHTKIFQTVIKQTGCPPEIIGLDTEEFIPVSTLGKVSRAKMRSMYEAGMFTLSGKMYKSLIDKYRLTNKKAVVPLTEPAEFQLRQIWADVLDVADVESIGKTDSFLSLGGDSFNAIRLVQMARESGLGLTIMGIFNSTDLASMATSMTDLEDEPEEVADEYVPSPFELLPAGVTPERVYESVREQCRLQPEDFTIEDAFPCTSFQEKLTAEIRKDKQSFTPTFVFELNSDINMPRFRQAWNRTIQACDTLRTRTIVIDGRLLQVHLQGKATNIWEDLETGEDSPQDVRAAIERARSGTVASDGAHQSKLSIFTAADGRHYLIWTISHVVFDGWATYLVLSKLRSFYDVGSEDNAAPGFNSFNRFIDYTQTIDQEASKAYWSKELEGARETTFPPGKVQGDFENGPIDFNSMDFLTKHITFSRASGLTVTSATLLRAAWGLVIAHQDNADDVSFLMLLSGRQAPVSAMDSMVGPSIAYAPIRIRMNRQQPILEFLQGVQAQALEMIEHDQYGLDKISEIHEGARKACRFRSMSLVQPASISNVFETAASAMNLASPVHTGVTPIFGGHFDVPLVSELKVNDNKSATFNLVFDTNTINKAKAQEVLDQMGTIVSQLANQGDNSMLLGDLSFAC